MGYRLRGYENPLFLNIKALMYSLAHANHPKIGLDCVILRVILQNAGGDDLES